MGMSRATRRAVSGVMIDLFDENTSLGWRVKYRVSAALALEKIALKQWREIWFDNGELAGVQPLKPEQKKTLGKVLVERLIAVTITLPEVKRNAGVYGRSRTIGMPEWKRLRRQHVAKEKYNRIVDPEDATERAIEKVRAWPFPASVMRDGRGAAVVDEHGEPVFGDKAVRVYPHAPKTQ